MANTLTGLIPTLYQSLDTVSRELVGMIPAVARNSEGASAAKDETITIPIVPTESAADITPAVTAPDTGDVTVGNTTMTISKSRAVPIRFNGEEMVGLRNGGTLNPIIANRFTQAFRTLTNEVETDLTALHVAASNAYGTAGTTPFASTVGDSAQARKLLEDNGAPTSDMHLVVDTSAGANLRTLGQLTKANEAGNDATLRYGVLGNLQDMMIGQSSQIVTSTAGTASSATTDNAGYAVGDTTITLASAGTGTLVAGDVITIAGDSNKYVLVSGDADVSGGGTFEIAEPGLKVAITTSATAITVIAAAARNMVFDRSAIQLITRAPAMPDGGDGADDAMNMTDPLSGVTYQVAVYRQYRQIHFEVGLAWGVKAVKPEHIALLLG